MCPRRFQPCECPEHEQSPAEKTRAAWQGSSKRTETGQVLSAGSSNNQSLRKAKPEVPAPKTVIERLFKSEKWSAKLMNQKERILGCVYVKLEKKNIVPVSITELVNFKKIAQGSCLLLDHIEL